MTMWFRALVRRHWPRLRLRTILLLTFVFVAALPGFGALFLRVYENALVRQTEAELVAQGAALTAAAAATWSQPSPAALQTPVAPEPPSVDLRLTHVLPDRPAPQPSAAPLAPGPVGWSNRVQPVLRLTAQTTLASILLLDAQGRILTGPDRGSIYRMLPEVRAALGGAPATTLRRNAAYRPHYALEWLSRASDLRIHHARPIVVDGRVVGVLLLSRSPRALFVGLYADRGKIMLGVAIIFGTLVVLSGLLSRGIMRPVEILSEATRTVAAEGGAVPPPPATAAIEIQALYVDFAAMAAAIDRRSRYLRDFAYAVSHELKTPLTAIGGTVELLQDHPEMTPAERDRFTANMAADVARLGRLVSRLLDLARADTAIMVEGAEADLTSVLHRVADAHRSDALWVQLDLPSGLPLVALPAAVIETAMNGLIDNSRQAGAATVTIAARPAGDIVQVRLHDDGSGIPAGDRDRIFEPFFTSRRAAGGTGLGLPITRSLLQAYRSRIALVDEGDEAAGAAFELTLRVRG